MYEYITLIEREETNRLIALEKEEDGDDDIDNRCHRRVKGQAKGKGRTDPRRTARRDGGRRRGLSIGNLNKVRTHFSSPRGTSWTTTTR